MDLDAYSAAHRDEWERLARLSHARRHTGREADELIDLYQAGATQLSAIKTTAGSSVQGDRLSLALSRARLRFAGTGTNVLRQLTVFYGLQLPAALYRIRWLSIMTAIATLVVGTLYAVWIATDPRVLANIGSEEELRSYAEQQFVSYYSDNPEGSFAGQVWTNNAWIAAQCVAFGITGLWVPYALFQNAQGVGQAAGIMAEYGRLDHFFLYIAPHGQLELYCIFVAAAAGLMIFWAWIAPGARTRSQALAEDGRALFTVAIGLALALLVSGVIEGYVTRQDWPWPIKIGIGTIALGAFLAYQWIVGGRAYRAGQTGDLEEFEGGARRLVAG
ncbi:putative membrane protein SpoIIM required for sporulation [Diaminobutyricimonas aerilata]|uniref:Putative membrane protein SpoIIM required for sporulation n=1 Tax=Diaminobutyricimonas aerilata TaxID=1162967 RepID=A0A2M9CH52_9MICO|nr:stage II sporulation protein M [Diaminobutyricimonas aerilata]PJJ71251.1 putative membrane protein SpoIIM required for sporulation [Diaminobutyricimonas aerilata]